VTQPGASTRSVHATESVDPATRSLVPPIVANSAFAYPDVASWQDAALGRSQGHIYSRNSNPTTDRFEAKVADLEGTAAATSFATGMAAISTTLLALTGPGARVVTVKDVYGGSYLLLSQVLPRWGVESAICETDDRDALMAAIGEGCDVLYLESPTNPTLKVVDVAALAEAAHRQGAEVVIDNTLATPVNQRPRELGADVVVHSASKFLGGHGDVLGGVACGDSGTVQRIYGLREIIGTGMDPQVAALMSRSLKTLGLRIARHNANALEVAGWLEAHPKVACVNYPGLASHPNHEVARRQMPGGFGGMLSFEVTGGFAVASRVLDRLQYAYLAANLGQVETIAGPPATTSHVELTADERAEAGIPEGLIRYSAGIEDSVDLIADLEQALDAA
jgi:cystathionine gamma-synthase